MPLVSTLPIALIVGLWLARPLLPPPLGDPCGPGDFPETWIHGTPDCGAIGEQPLQVHAWDERTFILRQSKCVTLQAPFLYLLLGDERALLIDSGATADVGAAPIQPTVNRIVRQWKASQGLTSYELVVAHSHAHGDHTAGDAQFAGQPGTTVVGTSLPEVQAFFGVASWPDDIVAFDLGGRVVDVIPTPGHSTESLSFYDRCSDLLFTGDTLYPGYLLVFQSQAQYVESIERLFLFSLVNPVSAVLGGHVEMTDTPGVPFPVGLSYHPDEHELPLDATHLRELHFAMQAIGLPLVMTQFDDFKLSPF